MNPSPKTKTSLRCDRNRRRSKRKGGRRILCQEHGCLMESASRKYSLFADSSKSLQERGMSQRKANLVMQNHTTVLLQDEWLEAFWCPDCQEKNWFHIKQKKERFEIVSVAPELWQRTTGTVPNGNPSVSEFSQRESKRLTSRPIL